VTAEPTDNWQMKLTVTMYNTNFLLSVNSGDFSVFYVLITKILPKMCNKSYRFGLESGKLTVTGYVSQIYSVISQKIVLSCSDRSECHITSGRLSYGFVMGCFMLVLIFVSLLCGMLKLLRY